MSEIMPESPKKLPNIILVMTDQLRAFELGCYGHPVVKTPHLDRLAHEGTRFEIACSNNPVCTPARSIVITGQYSRTCTGMTGNWGTPETERVRLKDPTLPEVLKEYGYQTGHTGKWHICPHPSIVGFDNHPNKENENPNRNLYFPNEAGKKAKGEHWAGHEFTPAYENELLDEFLDTTSDQPFFLFHNINLPHSPWWHVPEEYRTRYSRGDVQLRPNTLNSNGEMYDSDDWYKTHWGGGGYRKGELATIPELPRPYDLKNLYAQYYGMVECVDDQMGHLIESLKKRGQLDNTVILFTSDHGDNLGSHDLWNKETMNEESIRIPMIAWAPGKVASQENSEQVISLVDVAPTLLGLIGKDRPPHMQGRDLSSVVRGEKTILDPENNHVFIEGMQADVAIRTKTHTYGIKTEGAWNGNPDRSIADDEYQMYDNIQDPWQMSNLAKMEEQREIAEELKQKLVAWEQNTPWQHKRNTQWEVQA